MSKKILIINAGSSSIKFKIYNAENKQDIAWGICERIFIDGALKISYFDEKDEKRNDELKIIEKSNFDDHISALDYLLERLKTLKIINDLNDIIAVGHRVVQGGDYFQSSVIVDNNVIEKIEKLIPLAPLHNEPQLNVINILKDKLSDAKQIAAFDTSFHHTIPDINSTYAVPEDWIENHGVKKYGFHGLSYRYLTDTVRSILKKDKVNIIACHLGNGASVCVIKQNNSVNTTMGLTPLDGLIMGTRSGSIDPSIHQYISQQKNLSINEITRILNNESGLKALCGHSDFREICSKSVKGNDFDFTMDIYAKKVSDFIVQYINELSDKVHAIVFTGGIGENNKDIVKRIIDNVKISKYKTNVSDSNEKSNFSNSALKFLKKDKNYSAKKISTLFSKKIYVIKTDEESVILNDILKLI
ncbi:MAG: acetate/propionate family kinase [Mycoplasmoidaceae bacterium]